MEYNSLEWKAKVEKPYMPGRFTPKGSVICKHHSSTPLFVAPCPAKMYHMYPGPKVRDDKRKYMSWLAIHVGDHNHSPQLVHSQDSLQKENKLLKAKFDASPSSNLVKLKNLVIRRFFF